MRRSRRGRGGTQDDRGARTDAHVETQARDGLGELSDSELTMSRDRRATHDQEEIMLTGRILIVMKRRPCARRT